MPLGVKAVMMVPCKLAARSVLGRLWRARHRDQGSSEDRPAAGKSTPGQKALAGLDPVLAERIEQVVRERFELLRSRQPELFEA